MMIDAFFDHPDCRTQTTSRSVRGSVRVKLAFDSVRKRTGVREENAPPDKKTSPESSKIRGGPVVFLLLDCRACAKVAPFYSRTPAGLPWSTRQASSRTNSRGRNREDLGLHPSRFKLSRVLSWSGETPTDKGGERRIPRPWILNLCEFLLREVAKLWKWHVWRLLDTPNVPTKIIPAKID